MDFEVDKLTNSIQNTISGDSVGYIKEQDGVDFIINGKPLTDKEKKVISEFIKADREKNCKTTASQKKDSGQQETYKCIS